MVRSTPKRNLAMGARVGLRTGLHRTAGQRTEPPHQQPAVPVRSSCASCAAGVGSVVAVLLTIALATAPTVALAAEQTVAPAAIESAAPEQDLLTIYRLARDADRRLSAAEQRRRGADAQVRQARSQFLPQISAHAGYEHERQSQDFGEIDEDLDTSGWDATLSLTQPIFRRGNFIDLERARTGQQGGDLEVLLNEQRLVIDVTEAYFNVLLAQDELALVEAEGAAVASQRRRAERALEVGTGTQTDVDEARAAYDRVRAQRVAALNQLDVARESLRRLTGHSPGTLAGLHEGFEPQPVEPGEPEHWVELAGRHNLEVRLAELEDQLARHDVSARRAERWPEVDLEARYTHFSGERDQQQFRDGSPVVETLDGTTDTRSIRLQLSVPLFTGGGISSRIRAAEAERTATADELYDQRRASALDARSAFLGLTSERERVRALEQALVSARSNEASVRRGQEVGTRTTTDLLNAQSRRFETKRDLQAARYDYLLHFVRLHAAAGLAVDQALIAEINAQLQGID